MAAKHTILVVDDEEALREVVCQELAKSGYEVEAVEDGDIAIEILRKKNFELVLLDIKMPRLNGIEVLKFIQNEIPDTKVIMLTALNDLQHALEAKHYGAIDFITKPYNYDEVIKKINSILAGS
jgi:DNA-binding response OmpR family regulator